MNEKQILKPCRLSLQEQNRIIQLYVNNNLSIQQIVKQTHHSSITISKVLHNHGIDVGLGLKQYKPTLEEIEKVKQIINNHGSIREASRIIGRDQTIIKRIIQDNNLIYDYRPYNKNLKHDFFDIIDSQEKAWLLGFLFTDGSVRKVGNSYQIRLSIQLKDEEIINKIKNWLNIDGKTHYDKRENKECCGIEFASKNIFDKIKKYGIIPNKTYETKQLYIEKIPLKYQKAYVRGLFDGDGGLSFTGVNDVAVDFTSHYYQIVEQFQSYIDEHISKEQHNKITTNSSKSRCVWRGRLQVLKILDWLYEDATVFLKRKYDKYLWIKSTL